MKYDFINQLINEGYITFSEEAAEEFNEERNKEDDETSDSNSNDNPLDALGQFVNNHVENIKEFDKLTNGPESNQDNWNNGDDIQQQPDEQLEDEIEEELELNDMAAVNEFMTSNLEETSDNNEYAEEIKEEDIKIEKIQTVDIVSKVMDKYIEYTDKVDIITWNELVKINPKSSKNKKGTLNNWDYVEDVKTLLNKTFNSENIMYVDVFNNYYDKLTNGAWNSGLAVYSTKNYGRPFLTEGLYLLMYELAIDWATFLSKYYKDNPEIDPENWEDDSFVRKFPSLTLNSYIARLLSESDEFNDFMTKKEVFNLTMDREEFNITMKQIQTKKDLITTAGESLSYYANLVKHNYADILVGALNKLGVVIFLHSNCKMNLNERLNIIRELIYSVTSRKPIETDKEKNNINSAIKSLDVIVDNLLLYRMEARLLLDSDKENYIHIKNS